MGLQILADAYRAANNVDRLETDKNDIITIKANISGIDSTITGIEGEIVALQGEVATNTADIIANNTVTAANTGAIAANGIITGANTLAITGLTISDGNSLKKANIDAGDIGLFQTVGGAFLNIVFNTDHFKDVAIVATNRQFNLNDEYANLPATKNNKITWSSPLNYNIGTETASIDLQNYITSNILNSFLTPYTSSNFVDNIYLTKTAGLAYNGLTKSGNDLYQTIPSGNIRIGTNTNIGNLN